MSVCSSPGRKRKAQGARVTPMLLKVSARNSCFPARSLAKANCMAKASFTGAVSSTGSHSEDKKGRTGRKSYTLCGDMAWVPGDKGDMEPFIRKSQPPHKGTGKPPLAPRQDQIYTSCGNPGPGGEGEKEGISWACPPPLPLIRIQSE